MPTVSVIIPSYNCAHYLATAIESVLAQTYKDLEIIVIDDGSMDDTPDVVVPYLDRITYIRQVNKGLPAARNTGIRASTGDFIALLDSDDSWLPQKLTRQMPLFLDPTVGIVYTDFSVLYADGRTLSSYLAQRPLASEGFILDKYILSRFLFPSTMVLRREAMEQCGLFDEEMLAAEDIELFARICLRWKVARLPDALMIRTEGANNITANGSKLNDYTILAFEKILKRETSLPSSSRRLMHEELGRQHWWRAYSAFKAGRLASARNDLLRAMTYDKRNLRTCAPLLAASFLPRTLLQRLQTSQKTPETSA